LSRIGRKADFGQVEGFNHSAFELGRQQWLAWQGHVLLGVPVPERKRAFSGMKLSSREGM
jgi:hypothetical protein